VWYPNVYKKSQGEFFNDKLNGNCTWWYDSGNKKATINFAEGNKEGEAIRYFESGDVMVKMNFKENTYDGKIMASYSKSMLGESSDSMRFEINTNFKKGVPVGPFFVKETCAFGETFSIKGIFKENGEFEIQERQNIQIGKNGEVSFLCNSAIYGYPNMVKFLLSEAGDAEHKLKL
jgi:hypothetical protein